ncbi:hypothetical protein CYMTET_46734 [Cymbomonas tetramitiformis]|uniref:HotDog ACOT-type domain-containing protein n=1 Tax=Cymbomonas tetramitiformis TaxID=36881 RepID=A0AAE0EWT4_9CHLO|nr:hypothetical protein CYMTET_46734 [Cymbomonas tetramitiformis]
MMLFNRGRDVLNLCGVVSRLRCVTVGSLHPSASSHAPYSTTSASPFAATATTTITDELRNMRRDRRRAEEKIAIATRSQTDATPKVPKRTTIEYPFSTNEGLRQEYTNPWGFVRLGRVLEDLDSLAGNIAFLHCDDDDPETFPNLIVTASVDEVKLHERLCLDKDMQLSGAVTWVGRSSLNIRMDVRQGKCKDSLADASPSLSAEFTFVARNPVTGKSAVVHPLLPSSPEETALFQMGEEKATRRKQARVAAASPKPGIASNAAESSEEVELRRALLGESRNRRELPGLSDGDAVCMDTTGLENVFVCQPQHQNMAGRVFGGFIMRRAFELAFSTCYMFGGMRPSLLDVDEITFQKPVDVGNLMRLKSCILHTEPETGVVHVEVEAFVMTPECVSSALSNTFNFRFRSNKSDGGKCLKRVLPSTEEEARRMMQCIIARGNSQ